MALDPYGPCPCGSGKKLKFCCGDLAGEIDKILRMISGDQPKAALTHIERLLVKHPRQATLLELRAQLEIELGDFERARTSVAEFQSAAPDSAVPEALSSILSIANNESEQAVEQLQSSMSRVVVDLPRPVWQAMGIVGRALLEQGDIVAGSAHLRIYAHFAGQDDPHLNILASLEMDRRLPLRLREEPALMHCADDDPWFDSFDEACEDAQRGQWSRAEEGFRNIQDKFGPQPEVLYNLAFVQGWQGRREAMARGLHEFARQEVPLDDAIEAESLAQLIDPGLAAGDDLCETMAGAFAIQEEDELAAKFAGDKRFRAVASQDPANHQGPPPRSTWLLLDRPLPSNGAELSLEEVPEVIAGLQIYGKQTDRDARAVLLTQRPERRELATNTLREVAGDLLGASLEEDVVGRRTRIELELDWQPCFPPDTPPEKRRQLVDERRRDVLLNRWLDMPSPPLNGLTPQAAAADPQLRILVLAAMLNLELSLDAVADRALFRTLREKLQLPPEPHVDPELDDLSETSVARLARVDPSALPDDELLEAYYRALAYRHIAAILHLGEEVTSRTSLHAQINLLDIYRPLILFEPDPAVALRRLAACREHESRSAPKTPASDLIELEHHILRGDAARLEDSMNSFRARHDGNREVEVAALELLMRYGLIDNRAAAAAPSTVEATPPPAQESKIWTPDSERQQSKSAIWTP